MSFLSLAASLPAALSDAAPQEWVLLTLAWIALPLLAGFSVALWPRLGRYLALFTALASLSYGVGQWLQPLPQTLRLLDNFGVMLQIDDLSVHFIWLNSLVLAAVVIYCWANIRGAFFYTQMIILHGSINAVFICADFISIYVALEVIGIAAFLLIAYPRTNRAIWVALRYLFVSNTAMLFYLVGAILVYQAQGSFAFTGLRGAPVEATALIFLGLLTKGGVFISGLWLPLTHAEAETPVSALLSGTVVKAGVFPLVRCALMVEEVAPILLWFGLGTALIGVTYAILELDAKRLLAASTISQVGFVLVAPAAAGFYALSHGLAKSALFLTAGNLPSRDLSRLRSHPLSPQLWAVLAIGSLSISGVPLLSGFGAKAMTLKQLSGWPEVVMTMAAVGTAIAFAKFLFLPVQWRKPDSESAAPPIKLKPGFWIAMVILLGGLVAANGLHLDLYTQESLTKALLTAAGGWLAYGLVFRHFPIILPRVVEEFEHLIGIMSLVLVGLLWLLIQQASAPIL
jgi:multicomponent Na+:H+ antiporter subunit D